MFRNLVYTLAFSLAIFPSLAHAQTLGAFPPGLFDNTAALSPASGGGGVSGWASLIPQTGLVNAWPFDNTYTTSSVATDPIGSENATLTSVTLLGSGPTTHLNNAGVFNGTTSTGVTPAPIIPLAAFSIVIWVNCPDALGPRILANGHTDVDHKGIQLRQNSSNTVGLDVGNGTVTAYASVSITPSTWTMLTFTYDGTTLTPYSNAVAGTPVTLAGPVAAPTNNLAFGYNPAYSGDFYTGDIAGVAVYNRALSGAEITTILGL